MLLLLGNTSSSNTPGVVVDRGENIIGCPSIFEIADSLSFPSPKHLLLADAIFMCLQLPQNEKRLLSER